MIKSSLSFSYLMENLIVIDFLPKHLFLSLFCSRIPLLLGFWFWFLEGGSEGKESACNARDPGLFLGLGRSPREGNGNPLQYFCLKKAMDRGA